MQTKREVAGRLVKQLVMTVAAGAIAFVATTALAQEKVLKIGTVDDLTIIDPMFTTSHRTRDHGYYVYDTLFSMDANFEPQPQMVKDYSVSDDRLVYTFTLRDDLKFSDGNDVTTRDVVASLNRWGQVDSFGKTLWSKVKSLVAKNDRTFVLTLGEPFGLTIEALGKVSGNVPFIMPEKIAKTPVGEQISDPTGSGPFKLVVDEWVPGQKVVYVKNEHYVPRSEPASGLAGGKVVKVDKVIQLILPDAATMVSAVIAGEIDFAFEPPSDLVQLADNSPGIVVDVLDPLGSQGIIRFNHLHPPFNDVKARQAVLWAIDQDAFLRTVVGDKRFYATCYSMFVCGTPLETEVGADPVKQYDIAMAKKLLSESSYDGTPIVLLDPADKAHHHAATLYMASELRKIGFKVDVQAMALTTMFQRRAMKNPVSDGGWNMFLTGFGGVDMQNPLTNAPLNSTCDGTNWPGWPCNKEIEKLRTDFSVARSADEKKEIATELQKTAIEFATHGWYGQYLKTHIFSAKLTGLLKTAIPVFWNVEKM